MYHESKENQATYHIFRVLLYMPVYTHCLSLIFDFIVHKGEEWRVVLCIQLQDVDIQVFESKCRDLKKKQPTKFLYLINNKHIGQENIFHRK